MGNCTKIDLQNISDLVEYNGDISIPVFTTSLDAQDFFDVFFTGDSISVDDYDSIKTLIKDDSLFYFYLQGFLTEFKAELTIDDTLDLNTSDSVDNVNLDYAFLYFKFRNEMPVNIDAFCYLYDSASNTIYDTLDLGFLPAAPVDDSGTVILDQVQPHVTITEIDQATLEHFFNDADKLIVHGEVINPSIDSLLVYVEVIKQYTIDLQFAIEGSGTMRMHTGGK
jgi:hypothetical protein